MGSKENPKPRTSETRIKGQRSGNKQEKQKRNMIQNQKESKANEVQESDEAEI